MGCQRREARSPLQEYPSLLAQLALTLLPSPAHENQTGSKQARETKALGGVPRDRVEKVGDKKE